MRMIIDHKRRLSSALAIILLSACLLVAGKAGAAQAALSDGLPQYTYRSCDGVRSDPLQVVFYGAAANQSLLINTLRATQPPGSTPWGHIYYHTGWASKSLGQGKQYVPIRGACIASDKLQPASNFGAPRSRWHVRAFDATSAGKGQVWMTSPHYDTWDTSCGSGVGNHRIAPGGSTSGGG